MKNFISWLLTATVLLTFLTIGHAQIGVSESELIDRYGDEYFLGSRDSASWMVYSAEEVRTPFDPFSETLYLYFDEADDGQMICDRWQRNIPLHQKEAVLAYLHERYTFVNGWGWCDTKENALITLREFDSGLQVTGRLFDVEILLKEGRKFE